MDLKKIKHIEDLKQEKQAILDKYTQQLNANKSSMFSYAESFFKDFFSEKEFTITDRKGEVIATYATATVRLGRVKGNNEILVLNMPERLGNMCTLNIDIKSSHIPPYSNPRYISDDQEIASLQKEVNELNEKIKSGISPTLSFFVMNATGKGGTPISVPDNVKGQNFQSFTDLLAKLFV